MSERQLTELERYDAAVANNQDRTYLMWFSSQLIERAREEQEKNDDRSWFQFCTSFDPSWARNPLRTKMGKGFMRRLHAAANVSISARDEPSVVDTLEEIKQEIETIEQVDPMTAAKSSQQES